MTKTLTLVVIGFSTFLAAATYAAGQQKVSTSELLKELVALDVAKGMGGQNQQNYCKQYAEEYQSAAKKFFTACGRLAHKACEDAYNKCENDPNANVPPNHPSSDSTDTSSNSTDSASSTNYYSAQDFGGYSQSEIDKIDACPASGPGLDKLRKQLTKNQKKIDKVKKQIQDKTLKANEIKNTMQQLQAKFQKDTANENSQYQKLMTQTLPKQQQKKAQKLDGQLTQLETNEKAETIKITEIRAQETDDLNKAADKCYQYAIGQVQKRINDRTKLISQGTLKVQTQNDLWNQAGNTLQQRAGNYAYAEYAACLQTLTYEAQVESIKSKANINVTIANTEISSDQSQILKVEQQEVSLSQQNQTEMQQLSQQHNQNLQNIASKYQLKMQAEDTKLNALMGNNGASMQSVQQSVQQMIRSMLSDHKNMNNGLNDPVGQISMDGQAGVNSEIGQLQLELNALEAANSSILKAKKAESKAVSDPKNFLGDGDSLITAAADFAQCTSDPASREAAKLCHDLSGDPADCYFGGPSATQDSQSAQSTSKSTPTSTSTSTPAAHSSNGTSK